MRLLYAARTRACPDQLISANFKFYLCVQPRAFHFVLSDGKLFSPFSQYEDRGPADVARVSCQKKILSPVPTLQVMWVEQVHVALAAFSRPTRSWMWIEQPRNSLLFSDFCSIHATQSYPALVRINHRFFKQHAMFQDARFLMPSPPRLGRHTYSPSHFLLPSPWLIRPSTKEHSILITLFGSTKRRHQKLGILIGIEEISCTLRSYDKNFEVQH